MDDLFDIVKTIYRKFKRHAVHNFYFIFIKLFKKVIAKISLKIAETGEGSDECLIKGSLPIPIHFYSPIPDIQDLKERNYFQRVSNLSSIDFNPEKQLQYLEEIAVLYSNECDWPYDKTSNPKFFYLNNGCFSYGCAASLHCMIRHNKPKNVVEVGSGFSSKIISQAILKNKNEGFDAIYNIIDPYPNEIELKYLHGINSININRVELCSHEFFNNLEENDILFIDSGHTVRTGSDVNFLFLEILPILSKGVIIHIHDIPLPYEYPEVYFTNPKFRVFWTEAYLLQAFLSFNKEFEILLAMNYIQTVHMKKFRSIFQYFDYEKNWSNSGSFWMRRIQENRTT